MTSPSPSTGTQQTPARLVWIECIRRGQSLHDDYVTGCWYAVSAWISNIKAAADVDLWLDFERIHAETRRNQDQKRAINEAIELILEHADRELTYPQQKACARQLVGLRRINRTEDLEIAE